MKELPQWLAGRLAQRLPGPMVGSRFEPHPRPWRHYDAAPPDARPAAVLLLLYPHEGQWHLPLTLRPAHLAAHAGQVSLPGGAVEPGETTAAAALREFHEELGDDGRPIELLGTLSPLYVQASNYLVTPWVAAAASRPQFAANATEVEEVLEVPLAHLLDPAHFGSHTREHEGHTLFRPALPLPVAPHLGRHVHDSWRVGDDLLRVNWDTFGSYRHYNMRAVVFDMDGLMFNTEDVYTAVGTELLRRRGHAFTAELKDAMMGLQSQPSFEAMIRHCNLERHLAAVGRRVEPAVHQLFGRPPGAHARPAGTAGRLGAGRQCPRRSPPAAAASWSTRVCSRSTCEKGSSSSSPPKTLSTASPHPEIYLTAARRFGVPPAEMAVLEDSQNGCQAAASAGAFAVAVPGEHSRQHDFRMASLVVDSLADPRLYEALGITRGAT